MTEMTLTEARRIIADENATDSARTLEAVACWLRFESIADAKLLPIALSLEEVAGQLPALPAATVPPPSNEKNST